MKGITCHAVSVAGLGSAAVNIGWHPLILKGGRNWHRTFTGRGLGLRSEHGHHIGGDTSVDPHVSLSLSPMVEKRRDGGEQV